MLGKEVMNANIEENFESVNHRTALERAIQMAEDAEKSGTGLFMPDLNPLQMHYRAEIIILIESRGWKMKHWSVTGIPPFVCAYPVFLISPH